MNLRISTQQAVPMIVGQLRDYAAEYDCTLEKAYHDMDGPLPYEVAIAVEEAINFAAPIMEY